MRCEEGRGYNRRKPGLNDAVSFCWWRGWLAAHRALLSSRAASHNPRTMLLW